jgi:hypothetical protein
MMQLRMDPSHPHPTKVILMDPSPPLAKMAVTGQFHLVSQPSFIHS